MQLLRQLLLIELVVSFLSLPVLGRASASRLLLWHILSIATSHSLGQGRRHFGGWQVRIVVSARLVLVAELILVTCDFFALSLCWILVLRLIVTQHIALSILSLPLMRRIRDVGQVGLTLSLIASSSIRTPLGILRVVSLGLHNECSHIVFNVLLHKKVLIFIVVKK